MNKKIKNSTWYATIAGEKSICVGIVKNNNKKFEKAGKAIDGDKDDVVLCLPTTENKKEIVKKKGWFMEDVKQPSKAGMMCTIGGVTFYLFMKNMWIGDSGTPCSIMNDNTSMFDVININSR